MAGCGGDASIARAAARRTRVGCAPGWSRSSLRSGQREHRAAPCAGRCDQRLRRPRGARRAASRRARRSAWRRLRKRRARRPARGALRGARRKRCARGRDRRGARSPLERSRLGAAARHALRLRGHQRRRAAAHAGSPPLGRRLLPGRACGLPVGGPDPRRAAGGALGDPRGLRAVSCDTRAGIRRDRDHAGRLPGRRDAVEGAGAAVRRARPAVRR